VLQLQACLHLWCDLDAGYSTPHDGIASTRYDENSFAIADLTTDTQTFSFVHPELWHDLQHDTDPWPQ
jgi:hypothetical protein